MLARALGLETRGSRLGYAIELSFFFSFVPATNYQLPTIQLRVHHHHSPSSKHRLLVIIAIIKWDVVEMGDAGTDGKGERGGEGGNLRMRELGTITCIRDRDLSIT